MTQAQQHFDGDILLRWRIFTDKGPKIVWAESARDARIKGDRLGYVVTRVEPAESALDSRPPV